MQTLDEKYREINGIYLDANFHKDEFQLLAHLQEVIGGLSAIASGKLDRFDQTRRYMPKVIAWWLSLSGKVGVASVERMLWLKYPGVCPYCRASPHVDSSCKSSHPDMKPDWKVLKSLGERGAELRPHSLTDWQAMFGAIYPVIRTESMELVFARLAEEIGELAESIRVRRVAPAYYLSEAGDVFAWLMRVQNWHDLVTGSDPTTLESWLAEDYPGYCLECSQGTCACPAILDSAFGRLGHEVPEDIVPPSLIPIDDSLARFRQRVIRVGQREYRLKPDDLTELREGVDELLRRAYDDQERQGFMNEALMEVLYRLKGLNSATSINTELIGELMNAVASLPQGTKAEIDAIVSGFGTNLFAWLFTIALTGFDGTFVRT